MDGPNFIGGMILGVNIDDHTESSSTAASLTVPLGTHNQYAIGFTAAGLEDGPAPTRGTPSLDGVSFMLRSSIAVGLEGASFHLYSWFIEAPTPSASPISIYTGSISTGADAYSVFYSISNAVYHSQWKDSGQASYCSRPAYYLATKQGGRGFMMVGLAGPAIGMAPYPDNWTKFDETYQSPTHHEYRACSRKHSGAYPTSDSFGASFGGIYSYAYTLLGFDAVRNSY